MATAYTLKCYECIPEASGTCTDTIKECPSHCAATRAIIYAGGLKLIDVNSKDCVVAEHCIEASANFGLVKTVITRKCCTSELCNTQPAPEPTKSNPNGKKCFTCDGQSCTATLNCEGDEDYCISSKLTDKLPIKSH
ncbi:uncharacterized protein LOC144466579 [Epinephelus lanceolatus]